jgi:hypothetical protein
MVELSRSPEQRDTLRHRLHAHDGRLRISQVEIERRQADVAAEVQNTPDVSVPIIWISIDLLDEYLTQHE